MAMWYYSERNQQRGPVSWADLYGLAQEGRLRSSDMVWQEGTADWVRASQVHGLFGGSRGGAAVEERGDQPGPRRSRRDEADIESLTRRPRRQEGMSSGLKIGLIAGGVSLLLLVVVIVAIILVSNSDSNVRKPGVGGPVAGGAVIDTFVMDNMLPGDFRERDVHLRGGQNVEIRIDTTILDGGFADVDLEVYYDPEDRLMGSDLGPEKDCVVRFFVPRDGPYHLEVDNRGPGRASARITILLAK